jgi:hypothetical protein
MLHVPPTNVQKAIKKLKEAQKLLRKEFEGFSFTLDGKLIGDIGEALIKNSFKNSQKLKEGSKRHDLQLKDGTKIQIKTTQKDIVGMGLKKQSFEHLIVLKIFDDGKYEIIFDGPGDIVTKKLSKSTNSIKIERLRLLNKHTEKKIFKKTKSQQ